MRTRSDLLTKGDDVEAVVFVGAEPILVSAEHTGAEFLVEGLAGAGAGVTVDFVEVAGDPSDESSFEDGPVALPLVLAEDGVGEAVDGLRVARATGWDLHAAVERDPVGFADEAATFKHPENDGVLEEVLFLEKGHAQVAVVFALESHGAGNGVVGTEGDGHGCESRPGDAVGLWPCDVQEQKNLTDVREVAKALTSAASTTSTSRPRTIASWPHFVASHAYAFLTTKQLRGRGLFFRFCGSAYAPSCRRFKDTFHRPLGFHSRAFIIALESCLRPGLERACALGQVEDFNIAPMLGQVLGHEAAVAMQRRVFATQQAPVGEKFFGNLFFDLASLHESQKLPLIS